MKDTREYTVFPSNMDVLAAFKNMQAQFNRLGYKEDLKHGCNRIGYTVRLTDARQLCSADFAEFLQVLEEFPSSASIWLHSHWKSGSTGIGLDLSFSRQRIEVGIDGELATILGLHEKVRDVFGASSPEPPKSPLLSKYNVKKTVFLAHRFDEVGSATANSVCRFLARLGFQVVEGEGYESRSIPSKVSDRIDSQDIMFVVVTPGDATWIMSEAAYAKGKGKYIVMLAQEGLTVSKGILGADFEHIQFPEGIVEKAFSDVLFALPR